MRLRNGNGLLCLVTLVFVIAFTSTSIGGDICDRIFYSVIAFFGVRAHGHGVGLLYFVAEKGVHFTLFLSLALLFLKLLPDTQWRIPAILAIALARRRSE